MSLMFNQESSKGWANLPNVQQQSKKKSHVFSVGTGSKKEK